MALPQASSYLGYWNPNFPFLYSLTHFPQKIFLKIPFFCQSLSSTTRTREGFSNPQNLLTNRLASPGRQGEPFLEKGV